MFKGTLHDEPILLIERHRENSAVHFRSESRSKDPSVFETVRGEQTRLSVHKLEISGNQNFSVALDQNRRDWP